LSLDTRLKAGYDEGAMRGLTLPIQPRIKIFPIRVRLIRLTICATAPFVRTNMRPEVHWIDLPTGARLAIMPRPRAGDWLDGEVAGWRVEGIGVIVSLLEAEEVKELGLAREAGLCRDLDMEFVSFPFPDGGVPLSTGETMALTRTIVARLNEGKAVAVHCRAGIGHSSLIAACILVLLGLAPGMAFDLIGKARGVKVPDTEGQRDWVDMFREATKTGGIKAGQAKA
jgi:Cyclin-dependent kinase inhibitor 3 (CDKN3)